MNFNVYSGSSGGEIDVVGFSTSSTSPDHSTRTIYICEVAIHLRTGLQYNGRGNIARLTEKFCRGIEYARREFQGFSVVPMLWSPVVKSSITGTRDQMHEVAEIRERVEEKTSLVVDLVINERFLACLEDLRGHARKITEDIKSPVLRLLQIEEAVRRHIKNRDRRLIRAAGSAIDPVFPSGN